jgi:6,7-dimethyl-8-ribityllumazine synthase
VAAKENFLIKYITLVARTRTEGDFKTLTRLLTALGLKSREVEDYPHMRLQPFLADETTLEVVYRKNPFDQADLDLLLFDPDSAIEVIKRMGLKIVEDSSGPEPNHTVRNFKVELPGGTRLIFAGIRTGAHPEFGGLEGKLNAAGKTFAIVVSRFNSFITERLLHGAIDGLTRCGAKNKRDTTIVRVPGSFEIPSTARTLAETKKYDAIICIGCLLRGDTAHYDVIVNEVTRGIGQSAQETGVPHAFGVLTCDTLEQAIDRAGLKMGNKGFEAALAAVEMANLKKAVVGRSSLVVGKSKRSVTPPKKKKSRR